MPQSFSRIHWRNHADTVMYSAKLCKFLLLCIESFSKTKYYCVLQVDGEQVTNSVRERNQVSKAALQGFLLTNFSSSNSWNFTTRVNEIKECLLPGIWWFANTAMADLKLFVKLVLKCSHCSGSISLFLCLHIYWDSDRIELFCTTGTDVYKCKLFKTILVVFTALYTSYTGEW